MIGSEAKSAHAVSCTVDDSLQHAAGIMCANDCGTVPVIDARGRVIGAITARDICLAAYRRCLPLWHMDVGSTMAEGGSSTVEPEAEPSGTHPVARPRGPAVF
jgi:CBS domain-containing protein